jgi:hypothetical protein
MAAMKIETPNKSRQSTALTLLRSAKAAPEFGR